MAAVAAVQWQQWQQCSGSSGSSAVAAVAAVQWQQWQQCSGSSAVAAVSWAATSGQQRPTSDGASTCMEIARKPGFESGSHAEHAWRPGETAETARCSTRDGRARQRSQSWTSAWRLCCAACRQRRRRPCLGTDCCPTSFLLSTMTPSLVPYYYCCFSFRFSIAFWGAISERVALRCTQLYRRCSATDVFRGVPLSITFSPLLVVVPSICKFAVRTVIVILTCSCPVVFIAIFSFFKNKNKNKSWVYRLRVVGEFFSMHFCRDVYQP